VAQSSDPLIPPNNRTWVDRSRIEPASLAPAPGDEAGAAGGHASGWRARAARRNRVPNLQRDEVRVPGRSPRGYPRRRRLLPTPRGDRGGLGTGDPDRLASLPILVAPRADPARTTALNPNEAVTVAGPRHAAKAGPLHRVAPDQARRAVEMAALPPHASSISAREVIHRERAEAAPHVARPVGGRRPRTRP